ncbi:response regulator [Singulisphaera sp. Ch08]|uniref:Response regulator n=1 Tax=Singulisphaera sp. Ch08 TaxID=3120278 RepID=A0AAU7CIC1_9BACT
MMASRRILLVEDSSTMRRMLSTLLQDEGYEIALARDGKEGLAKAREIPLVDLILTDFEMPELNGAGFAAS